MIKTAGDLAYLVGVDFVKSANGAKPVYHLAGRLYLSGSNWLLMSIPNAMARGAFDALDEPGIQLPTRNTDDPDATFNAHVSVMNKDEVEKIGPDNIHERGHMFRYTLGAVKTIEPKTWNGVSKVWYITVHSPELRALRKSYGLSAQPNEDWDFHITIGIRKTGVLHANEKSKAAEYVTTHEHVDPAGNVYNLTELFKMLEGREPETLNLADVTGATRSKKTGFSPRRMENADESIPMTIDENQGLIDGRHRYLKLQASGALTGRFNRVTPEEMDSVKIGEERGPEGEYCPNCDARMEYDDGKCNSCGHEYELKIGSLLELFAETADAG